MSRDDWKVYFSKCDGHDLSEGINLGNILRLHSQHSHKETGRSHERSEVGEQVTSPIRSVNAKLTPQGLTYVKSISYNKAIFIVFHRYNILPLENHRL
jgi:hypothetical protein